LMPATISSARSPPATPLAARLLSSTRGRLLLPKNTRAVADREAARPAAAAPLAARRPTPVLRLAARAQSHQAPHPPEQCRRRSLEPSGSRVGCSLSLACCPAVPTTLHVLAA